MYIYNVTTSVDAECVEEWLQWVTQEHVPAMIDTGKFTSAKLTRVLVQEEKGAKTFSIQYAVKDRETFKSFYLEHSIEMNAKSKAKFGEKAVFFQTELEVLGEYK